MMSYEPRVTAPSHTLYGQEYAESGVSRYGAVARTDDYRAGADVVPSLNGVPFLGRQLCAANNDTCKAPRVTGGELCVGHARALAKLEAARK